MLTDTFLLKLKQKYIDAFSLFNPDSAFEKEQLDFTTKAGQVEVNVSRGAVFEKVCVSNISATVRIPDREYQSSIQWLGVQTFPSNPMVPLLMAVFERVDEQGLVHHPGFFDVYPIVPFEEDKLYIQKQIGAVCRKHGRKYPDLPESYREMFRMKETGIGVGYAAGLSLMPDETNHDFFMEAADAIFNAYFAVVKKRKDSTCSQEQMKLMNRFRSEWVRFTFMDNRFFQGGVSMGVPPLSFMQHMLPPSVRF